MLYVRLFGQSLLVIKMYAFILKMKSALMENKHLKIVSQFSDFFPYITGTDKGYHSQCQKLLIFPNLETKISQFHLSKN